MRIAEALDLLDLRPRALESDAKRLASCHEVEDVRRLAARRVPKAIFDFIDGAADDEVVKDRNREAFRRVVLAPRQLVGEGDPQTVASLLGDRSALPLAIAPCGQNQLMHPDAEPGVARAASGAGIPYVAPCMGSRSLEEIASEAHGPLWFQVYLWRDTALTKELIRRARQAGYGALVITVDTPTSGVRTRDLANGLKIPPKLSWRGALDAARHPRWTAAFLRGDMPTFANVARPGSPAISTMNYVGSQFDPGASWDGIAELVAEWDGPFAIKGVLSAEDARRAVSAGASAVIVSNHGGRQFGRAPSTLEVLPRVVDEVAGAAQVLLDSGVMRGMDIAAAVAAGADGCMVGRAAMYGLAAAGEAGVSRTLEILAEELRRAMVLLGAASTEDLKLNLNRADNPDLWKV